MAGLAIAYTSQNGGGTWNIVFKEFTSSDFPRQWESAAGFARSQTGALVQGGPRYSQKYIWVIDCLMDAPEALLLNTLYASWDYDRSQGKSVAVGVTDATFGSLVTTQASFTTPPTFTYASPRKTIVSFGMVQV
jgi:hypothetical protein